MLLDLTNGITMVVLIFGRVVLVVYYDLVQLRTLIIFTHVVKNCLSRNSFFLVGINLILQTCRISTRGFFFASKCTTLDENHLNHMFLHHRLRLLRSHFHSNILFT
jgi:hypothetical protein